MRLRQKKAKTENDYENKKIELADPNCNNSAGPLRRRKPGVAQKPDRKRKKRARRAAGSGGLGDTKKRGTSIRH